MTTSEAAVMAEVYHFVMIVVCSSPLSARVLNLPEPLGLIPWQSKVRQVFSFLFAGLPKVYLSIKNFESEKKLFFG